MVKTKMTLMGKIFMALFFMSTGLAAGFYYGKNSVEPNNGNKIEVTVDGKIKDGSDVNINLDGINQDHETNKKKKEENKGNFFQRLFD